MATPDLILETFTPRRDVFAKMVKRQDGSTFNTPVCVNEFKRGICRIAKGVHAPCDGCPSKEYRALELGHILNHLRVAGKVVGAYALWPDDTCRWVAADLDNHTGELDPLRDVTQYVQVCDLKGFPVYVFSSKSGRGFHVYIFFSGPVPAWKARAVAWWLLEEAGIVGDIPTSFDRLFPNQDQHSGKGLGNLINLPYQAEAMQRGFTLMLNPGNGFRPFEDQAGALQSIQRVGEAQLDKFISEWDLSALDQRSRGNGGKPPTVNFSVGHHDDTLFSIAWHLARGGMPEENVTEVVRFIAYHLDPGNRTEGWADTKVRSAFDRLQAGEDQWDESGNHHLSQSNTLRQFVASSH